MKKSKRKITLILSCILIIAFASTSLASITTPDISIKYLNMIPEQPEVGDEVTVTYELDPKPFKKTLVPSVPKEIVLVLDGSGSMKSDDKIGKLKVAARKFIQQLKNTEDLKISVVAFSTQATINPIKYKRNTSISYLNSSNLKYTTTIPSYDSLSNELLLDASDTRLEKIIDSIQPIGGTNSGEGLRKAEFILKNGNPKANKSIVFMSDGLPTFMSVKGFNGNDRNTPYLNIDNLNGTVKGDGNESSQNNINNSSNYAKEIGKIISNNSYNIFSVGYGLGSENSTRNKTLRDIHKSMGGLDKDFFATDNEIDKIFEQIAEELEALYSVKDTNIDISIDSNVELIEPMNTKPKIEYKLESDGWYRGEKVKVQFKFKANKPGIIDVVNDIKLNYKDMDGNKVEVIDEKLKIEIKEKSILKIEVNDSSGVINNKYNTDDDIDKKTRYDKIIKNEFGQEYKLFGDSYAKIEFEGSAINHLKYQFIKSDEVPNQMPVDGWKELSVDENKIPDDIVLQRPGYLTQKSYDLSHMPSGSNTTLWKDRNEVFKNPFDEIKEKPARKPLPGESYFGEEEYIDKDGNIKKRPTTNTIFTNSISPSSNNYKEANKSWGYFKVPKSGYYTFRTHSDDGIYGKLSINSKEDFIIADGFGPWGSHPDVMTSGSVYLNEEKYYPIYLEYYNWGGPGKYSIQYSFGGENSKPSNSFIDAPAECFYPSLNKGPGEHGGNTFNGETGINLPKDVGKYYIAYKSGIKDDNTNGFSSLYKEGIYGPFIVDERFTLKREIKENNTSDTTFDYILEYTLQPNPIRITDMYKNKNDLSGTIKSDLDIQNMKLKDKVPQQIKIEKYLESESNTPFKYVVSDGKIEGINGNGIVTYKLKLENKKEDSMYISNPIILKFGVNSLNLDEINYTDNDGILMYKDVSINNTGGNKEQKFPQLKYKPIGFSKILDHGLYSTENKKASITGKEIQSNNIVKRTIDVINGMYYNMGVKVEMRNNSKLEIKLPSNVNVNYNAIYINEIDKDNNIISSKKLNIQDKGNSIISVDGLESNKNYIITYSACFNSPENIKNVESKLDKSSKELQINIISNEGDIENKEVELPELF